MNNNKSKNIQPLAITAKSIISCAGNGVQATLNALLNQVGGLSKEAISNSGLESWIGRVKGVENITFDEASNDFLCRNNQLAKMAINEDDFYSKVNKAVEKYGNSRIGLFVGTSTSGGEESEKAYYHAALNNGSLPPSYIPSKTQALSSLQDYIQQYFKLKGPGLTISTACSSSSKVFASAYRHIMSGECDAAIVGGVDSLCLTTLFGFNSLQLISKDICRPFDKERSGINIGEAAGFILLESAEEGHGKVKLKGYGESSDAYHMSAPQPKGKGAKIAMESALIRAGLSPLEIDYINLHGTGTVNNDLAESNGISSLFKRDIPCSSTKGFTGHTLGAAGIIEAIISIISLENNILPVNLNLQNIDPEIEISPLKQTTSRSAENIMTNNFGFGGSNSSLIFGW